MVHRQPVYIYLFNVPSFSSRHFNKIKRTSRLGRLLALSLEILLPDSVNHFAALKAKFLVCGSGVNKVQYFVYALTSTYCQSFMKI